MTTPTEPGYYWASYGGELTLRAIFWIQDGKAWACGAHGAYGLPSIREISSLRDFNGPLVELSEAQRILLEKREIALALKTPRHPVDRATQELDFTRSMQADLRFQRIPHEVMADLVDKISPPSGPAIP